MLYFLKNNDKVKIGYTNDPAQRISNIQTANPEIIECLLLIDGGFNDEAKLHSQFQKDRIRLSGEWFYLSQDILEFINNQMINDRRYEFGLIEKEARGNEQLMRVRKTNNLKLAELAKLANMTASGIKEAEKRELDGSITINKMQEIASLMGYKVEYRIIKDDSPNIYV